MTINNQHCTVHDAVKQLTQFENRRHNTSNITTQCVSLKCQQHKTICNVCPLPARDHCLSAARP